MQQTQCVALVHAYIMYSKTATQFFTVYKHLLVLVFFALGSKILLLLLLKCYCARLLYLCRQTVSHHASKFYDGSK